MDALESISPPPAAILQVNLLEEQRVNLLGGTDSIKSFSNFGRFRKRNTWTKSVKKSSSAQPICLVVDNSSGFVSDGLDAISSDLLVNDAHAPQAGQSVGRSFRRKGKRKGKQYQRSTHIKNSVGLENQCSEGVSSDSLSVTSVNSNAACLSKHILERKFSNSGMVSDSGSSDTSFHRITANSCDLNSELSNDCHISSGWSKDDVDTFNNSERAQYSSQACSSSGFHPVISEKRGRLARNVHGRTGKYSCLSVWQKVQRVNNEECICKAKKGNKVIPQVDISSKGSKTRMMSITSNPADSSEICSRSNNGKSKNDVRGKPSSGSKQGNCYPRKEYCASTVNMVPPSKIHVRQKELEILARVNQKKHRRPEFRSHCTTDSQQVLVKPADRSDCCQSEPHQQTNILMEEETSPRNNMTSPASYLQIGSSLMALDSLDQKQIEARSDSSNGKCSKDMHEDLCPTDNDNNRRMNLDAESSHAECSKLDNSSIHVFQKWITVGGKDPVVLKTSHADESVCNKPDSNNSEVEVLNLNTHYLASLTGGALPYLNVGTGDINCSSPEADELTSKLRSQSYRAGEFDDGLALSKCHLTQEIKIDELSGFETGLESLDKIIQAVNDSYKLQPLEGVHPASVGPFADFEELIHNVSPVIGQCYSINSCKSCSREESIGTLLCSHQIPSISLGSLWQWYEEPGCYGMEVKAEDYCISKSLRYRCLQFSAYFVPLLSAVQLFSQSTSTNNANFKAAATKNSESDKTSNTSSNLGSLPIFSLLLPRPRRGVDTCFSDSSSSSKDEFSNRSVRNTFLGDKKELIFEYFESQQPHQRRPLFEKIKELVRGDTLSNCQLFGDPLKLEYLNLHDLHPASWYSVAWYPIYRIPDGNFHAAFLTYHSLGHFAHRSGSSEIRGLSHIVSSVVGLQSYNTKGESWFEPRGSKSNVVQTEGSLTSDPLQILEERLGRLERTARVMATASVQKGDQISVNKQPDYEFFSRRR